jgi:hypothetical protein
METVVDSSYNLNNFEFVIKPVQNFSGFDNNLLMVGLLAILLLACFKENISIGYNKYICKLK